MPDTNSCRVSLRSPGMTVPPCPEPFEPSATFLSRNGQWHRSSTETEIAPRRADDEPARSALRLAARADDPPQARRRKLPLRRCARAHGARRVDARAAQEARGAAC